MRRRFIQNSLKGFDFDNYLTIEALEDGLTVSMSATLEYCINGDNEWKVLSKNGFTGSINTGEVVSFRGKLSPEIAGRGIGTFVINKRCNVKGNCMSLIFKDDAKYNFNLPSVWGIFFELFNNCTTIINASDLILQATGLAPSCYSHMFYGCYNLECAPKLPATELYNSCYESMFENCSDLIVAPKLLAPILKNACYKSMFEGCTKLNYIKMLATDISASNCLMYWTINVAPSGTFIKHPEATWDVVGASGVPSGWTVKFDGEEDGGGKIVNTITFSVEESGPDEYSVYMYMQVAPASDIYIKLTGHSSRVNFPQNGIYPAGRAFQMVVGYPKIEDFTIEPSEDSTYIYQLVEE